MPDISWDHAAEARAALNAIVTDPEHGVAALSSAQTMSNLLKDFLPDAPKEKQLLVAAAEAGLANTLREHVAQGMDPSTAISLTASSFANSTPFPPEACSWVAGELATAMGIVPGGGAPAGPGQVDQGMATQIRPIPGFGSQAGQPQAGSPQGYPTQVAPQAYPQGQGGGFGTGPAGGQPGYSPSAQPGGYSGPAGGQPGYSPSGQPGGYSGPAGSQPGYSPSGQPNPAGYSPSGPGGQPTIGGYSPGGGYAAGPGGQATVGGYSPSGQVGGYSPSGQVGGYTPGGPAGGFGPGPGFGPPAKSGAKRGLLIGGGIVVTIIVLIVIAASLSSKGTPSANSSNGASTSQSPSPSPSPTPTPQPNPGGVESLNTIMNPSGLPPVGTSCERAPSAGLNTATLISRLYCPDTSINFVPTKHIVVWAYQFDSYNDYLAGFAKLNQTTGFKSAGAAGSCPPPGSAKFGLTTWDALHNPKYNKSHESGQKLECFIQYTTTHKYQPLLIWSMASQHVVFIARDEATGGTFAQLDKWWTHVSYG